MLHGRIITTLALSLPVVSAFSAAPFGHSSRPFLVSPLRSVNKNNNNDDDKSGSGVQEYRNAITGILSNFMQDDNKGMVDKEEGATEKDEDDPLGNIDFDGTPKIAKMNLERLAAMLDAELYEKEWFVTGNVNPAYFADTFEFQDPDVKLQGIEDYARGVYKLFNQETSRAEIISTVVNTTVPNTITVTWRLSGKVNIGPGLVIKPYICYTDFSVDDDSGLIVFQEDRFDIPGWDILLSSLFPFLIGKVTAPAAPPVDPRPKPVMPSEDSPLDALFQLFSK